MIIKCTTNKPKDLPSDLLFSKDADFYLIIDKYYIVYAIMIYKEYTWYGICDEGYTYYPSFRPSPLFSISNGQLSRYWIYSCTRGKETYHNIWAFPEWANNPYYYDSLTDRDEKEVEIFKHYKGLMNLEFPNPEVLESDKAISLDEGWLLCPFCIEACQTDSKDGMVICPICKRMLHNPNYEDKMIKFNF